MIVAVVLAVLAAVVVARLLAGGSRCRPALDVGSDAAVGGVLQAAGLLFFAFAGYARIATLGEEVRDPARTIPRAIPIALGITLVVYAAVAVAVLAVLGPDRLAAPPRRWPTRSRAAGAAWLAPVVRVGAAVAALGSLLALILGVSRTTLAMARDRHLPPRSGRRPPALRVPHRAELAVGAVVARAGRATRTCAARSASPPSACWSTTPIANASAWTLTPPRAVRRASIPVLGLAGCLALAFALPPTLRDQPGSSVLTLGSVAYLLRRRVAQVRH